MEEEEEEKDESDEPSQKRRKLSEGDDQKMKKRSKQPKEAKETISKPVKDESVKPGVNKPGSLIGKKRRERKGKKGSK